jgi:hypothetical protein
VWKILEPCVVLASMILYKANIYPWYVSLLSNLFPIAILRYQCRWDAMINGKIEVIPIDRCPPSHKDPKFPLHNFRQRPTKLAASEVSQAVVEDRLCRKAPSSIKVRLYSGYENPKTGLPEIEFRSFGLTYTSSVSKFIWINAAIENLQPLLRDDLLESEMYVTNNKMIYVCCDSNI